MNRHKKHYLNTKLVMLILVLMLSLSSVFAYNIGDYRSKYGMQTFTNATAWETYTASGWLTASSAPSSPFSKTLYINHYVPLDVHFQLSGKVIMGSRGVFVVQNGRTLVIEPGAIASISALTVNSGARLINNGTIDSAILGAVLKLEHDNASAGPAVLENNARIELLGDIHHSSHNLVMNTNSKLISGAYGTISGTGSISTNAGGVYYEIANPNGFDGAISLSGDNQLNKAHFLFNGTTDQESGLSLPAPIFSLMVDNPEVFTISKSVALSPWDNAYFHVTSGSTVDMGQYIIYSQDWGNASFKLDDGSKLLTANPEGISSETRNQKIYLGCIQTNTAFYSSAANYGYTGTEPQYSGNFVTTPAGNAINDLIVTNPSGLTLKEDIVVNGTVYGAEYIEGNETLPVVLSSFNAGLNSATKVQLSWITQSETNCLGYYVHRGNSDDLSAAQKVSALIEANNTSLGGSYVFVDKNLDSEGTYYYWLEDVSLNSVNGFHGPIQVVVTGGATPGIPEVNSLTRLDNVFPNPFNPSTSFRFSLEKQGDVSFEIYNHKGQKVDSFSLKAQSAGSHTGNWDASKLGLSSGVYFVKFSANGISNIRKMIMSK